MIQLHHHPHLDDEQILRMVQIHHEADIVLIHHYASHVKHMTAHELFAKVAERIKKRTKIEYFLGVLMFDPKAYKLIEKDEFITDYSPFYVAIFGAVVEFAKAKDKRKLDFERAVNNWIATHPEQHFFDTPKVEDLVHKPVRSPVKQRPARVVKPPNDLKNDASKFKFKEKNEAEQQNKTGLTLLERIQFKEKQNRETQKSPEEMRESYLKGKLIQLYDIIHHLHSVPNANGQQAGGMRSFPLTKLVQTVKDSLDYPIEQQEVIDALKLMEMKLGHKVMEIVTRSGLSVVKVHQLDRSRDLQAIQ